MAVRKGNVTAGRERRWAGWRAKAVVADAFGDHAVAVAAIGSGIAAIRSVARWQAPQRPPTPPCDPKAARRAGNAFLNAGEPVRFLIDYAGA
jgi:hypothetical protein